VMVGEVTTITAAVAEVAVPHPEPLMLAMQ
jgi:hypothetical protein